MPLHTGYCNTIFHTHKKWWEAINPERIWRFRGDAMAKTCAKQKREQEREEMKRQKLEGFLGRNGSMRFVGER